MDNEKKIESAEELIELVNNKKAVVWGNRRIPAAFMVNMPFIRIMKMIDHGILKPYERKK